MLHVLILLWLIPRSSASRNYFDTSGALPRGSLFETMPQNTDLFSELLGADFAIRLSGETTMQSLDDLKAYVVSLREKVASGVHDITSIQINELEEDVFSLSIDVYWSGVSIDSKQLERRTKHEWILCNNKDERFARLLQMNITVL